MESVFPARPLLNEVFTNRLFEYDLFWGISNNENIQRIELWKDFFEENISRSISHYNYTSSALENFFDHSDLIVDQSCVEFNLSLEFWQSIFRTHKALIVTNERAAQKILVLSLIYGKFPGMFIRSHTQFIRSIDAVINEQVMDRFFCHCLVKYETPSTLIRCFEWLTSQELEIILHAFKGLNMRKHPFFPVQLTSRDFVKVMSETTEYTRFEDTILLRSLAYSMISIDGVKESNILGFLQSSAMFTMDPEQYLRDIEFWKKGFELIYSVREEHNFRTYTDCADYLDFMKYQSGEVYSLRGRTGRSLLRAINEWHEDIFLTTNKKYEEMEWDGIDKPDMAFNHNNKEYVCRQLKDGQQLKTEGEKMKHCVTTYSPMCKNGYCSIWSLRNKSNKEEPILTLEITKNKIVQARGKHNDLPTGEELAIVHDWAERMEFKIDLIKND